MTSFEREIEHYQSFGECHKAERSLWRKYPRFQTLPADALQGIIEFINRTAATGVVLYDEEERSQTQRYLRDWYLRLPEGLRRPLPFSLADYQEQLQAESESPYVGLEAFREETSNQFFGREHWVNELVKALRTTQMLEVLGSSGSGKSSLVLAGLIPALKHGAIAAQGTTPPSNEWVYVPRMVPGSDPLANLAQVIVQVSDPNADDPKALEGTYKAAFKKDPRMLAWIATKKIAKPIVLVVDQFEEIFTLCQDDVARQDFINNIDLLTRVPDMRHTAILTRRSDFDENVVLLRRTSRLFNPQQFRIPPLSEEDLREAIRRPAATVGLYIEPEVVERLVQEFRDTPTGLPLLQFTLLELWKLHKGNAITQEDYHTLGGGRQALERSANHLYESLIPEEQTTFRLILLSMVQPGERGSVTSQRVSRAVLHTRGEDPDRIDRVLSKLVEAGLVRLTLGASKRDDQAEVTHEALIRNWPLLLKWIEEERPHFAARWRLTAATQNWLSSDKDPGALWGEGELLRDALKIKNLGKEEMNFLGASIGNAERQKRNETILARAQADQAKAEQAYAEEQAQRAKVEQVAAEEQKRNAEAEQKHAEDKVRSAQQTRRWVFWSIGVLGVLALLIGTISWNKFTATQARATVAEKDLQTATAGLVVVQATLDHVQEVATSVNQTAKSLPLTQTSVAVKAIALLATAGKNVDTANTSVAAANQTATQAVATLGAAQASSTAAAIGLVGARITATFVISTAHASANTEVYAAQMTATTGISIAQATMRQWDFLRSTAQTDVAVAQSTTTALSIAVQTSVALEQTAAFTITLAAGLPRTQEAIASREANVISREGAVSVQENTVHSDRDKLSTEQTALATAQAALATAQTALAIGQKALADSVAPTLTPTGTPTSTPTQTRTPTSTPTRTPTP